MHTFFQQMQGVLPLSKCRGLIVCCWPLYSATCTSFSLRCTMQKANGGKDWSPLWPGYPVPGSVGGLQDIPVRYNSSHHMSNLRPFKMLCASLFLGSAWLSGQLARHPHQVKCILGLSSKFGVLTYSVITGLRSTS